MTASSSVSSSSSKAMFSISKVSLSSFDTSAHTHTCITQHTFITEKSLCLLGHVCAHTNMSATCLHTHIHVCTHTYMSAHTHTCLRDKHVYTSVCVCVCTSEGSFVCVCVCVCRPCDQYPIFSNGSRPLWHVCVSDTCMCVCVCVYVYVCLCVLYLFVCVCVCAGVLCVCVCVWVCIRVCGSRRRSRHLQPPEHSLIWKKKILQPPRHSQALRKKSFF